MNYTILLIMNVVCDETRERYCHRGSVNAKLRIVQVKLRFHGGKRRKERVKDWVSQVTEHFLLVLCLTVFLACDWCEHHDV
jgi:hypothetical protein